MNLNKVKIRKQENIVICANNLQIHTKGRVNVKVNIGLGMRNLECILAKNLFPKCIIGIPGLKKLDAELNIKDNCAVNKTMHIPLLSVIGKLSSQLIHKIFFLVVHMMLETSYCSRRES